MATLTARAGTVTTVDGGYSPTVGSGNDVDFSPTGGTLVQAMGSGSDGTTKFASAACNVAFEQFATYRLKLTNFDFAGLGLPSGATINSVSFFYRAKKTGTDTWQCPSNAGGGEASLTHSLQFYNANGSASINEYADSGTCRYNVDLTLSTSYAQKTEALGATTDGNAHTTSAEAFFTAANLRDSGFTCELGWVNLNQSVNGTISVYDFYITVDYTALPGAFDIVSVGSYEESGGTDVELAPLIDWEDSSGASTYTLKLSVNSDMSGSVDVTDIATSQYTPSLEYDTLYYVRVVAVNAGGSTNSTSTWSFRTIPNPERISTIATGLIAAWDLNGPASDGHWKGKGGILASVTDSGDSSVWPGSDLRPSGTVIVDSSGKRGAAANFNNAGTLCCVDQTNLLLNGNWSAELWIKPLDLGSDQFLFAKRADSGTTASTFEFAFRQSQTSGFAMFMLNAAGNSTGSVSLGVTPTVGVWNHVIVTVAGTTGLVRVYLNGGSAVLASPSVTHATFTANGQSSTLDTVDGSKKHLVIGGNFPTSATQRYKGSIDLVRFWNKLLTAAEATTLWANGGGLSNSQLLGGGLLVRRRRMFGVGTL